MAGKYVADGYVASGFVSEPIVVPAPSSRRVVVPISVGVDKRSVSVAPATRRVVVAEVGS